MFRGGRVNSYGTGIASGLADGGRVGMFMGGSQALSRSYFASLIPLDKSGELFGYFSTVGRISTVVGPFLYFGAVGLANQRAGVFIISILILLGTILLKWPFLLRIKDDD